MSEGLPGLVIVTIKTHRVEKGRVVEQGSHLELLRKKGLYFTLWQQQGLERDEDAVQVVARGA